MVDYFHLYKDGISLGLEVVQIVCAGAEIYLTARIIKRIDETRECFGRSAEVFDNLAHDYHKLAEYSRSN